MWKSRQELPAEERSARYRYWALEFSLHQRRQLLQLVSKFYLQAKYKSHSNQILR
jgi:hypothetical protein